MMPNRQQILERAIAQWKPDRCKAGDPSFDLNPEISELREAGYLNSAKSELMMDKARHQTEQYHNYIQNVENLGKFSFDSMEIMNTTAFVSGSRNSGKSDVCMYIADKLISENITVICFDPSTDWFQRSSISEYITIKPNQDLEIPKRSIVFDMSQLTPMQSQRTVENFAKKLFDYQVANDATRRFFLVLEEAQIYYPLNSLRSKQAQNSMRLLTVGRNLKISLIAVSQFPSAIDKEVVRNAGQLWIGYTAEYNTLKYWRGILGSYTDKLKKLSSGQFVYRNRNSLELIEIQPYENSTVKKQIVTNTTPKTEIESLPKITAQPKTESYALAKFLIVSGIGLLWLLLTIGAI